MTTSLSIDSIHVAEQSADASARLLRVAYVVSTFEAGGLERCVAHLVNHLDSRQFQPIVISLTGNGGAASWIERDDVQILTIGKRPGNDLRAVKRLSDVLKSERVDVMHSHNWGTLLESVVARRRAKIPVHVHAEHGQELEALRASKIKRYARRQAMAWGLRRVDAIVACAHAVQNRIGVQSGLPAVQIRFIPNGVDLGLHGSLAEERPSAEISNNPEAMRARLGIPENAFVLGSLGRLAAVKDFPTAIRALAVLVARGWDVHLVLAGEGSDRERLLQTAAAENIAQRVHLVGRQPNIATWLRMFDLYVNSSISEAMNLGILEAMAAGVSVVATDVGDTAELLCGTSPCGFTVPPGDPQKLADAADRLLLDEPLHKTLAANGVRRHAERYSVTRMVSDYANLYLELSVRER